MGSSSPSSEPVPEDEMRPGEDVMDYVERESERIRKNSEKTMAEFKALCQATKEKFQEIEVCFYQINNAVGGVRLPKRPLHPDVPPDAPCSGTDKPRS